MKKDFTSFQIFLDKLSKKHYSYSTQEVERLQHDCATEVATLPDDQRREAAQSVAVILKQELEGCTSGQYKYAFLLCTFGAESSEFFPLLLATLKKGLVGEQELTFVRMLQNLHYLPSQVELLHEELRSVVLTSNLKESLITSIQGVHNVLIYPTNLIALLGRCGTAAMPSLDTIYKWRRKLSSVSEPVPPGYRMTIYDALTNIYPGYYLEMVLSFLGLVLLLGGVWWRPFGDLSVLVKLLISGVAIYLSTLVKKVIRLFFKMSVKREVHKR